PHTSFEPKYSLGQEIKIESEEVADVVGQFDIVHNHPKQKLMNQFSFWLSAAVGFIESALILIGRQTSTAVRTSETTNLVHVGVVTATTGLPIANFNNSVSQEFRINTVGDLVGLNIPQYIQKNIAAGNLSALSIIGSVLTLLAALAIKVPYSIMGGIKA